MFTLSKEILVGLLVFLGLSLLVIIVLIFKKQRQLKNLQSGEVGEQPAPAPEQAKEPPEAVKPAKAPAEKPALPETGPTDAESIKASIMVAEKKPEAGPVPKEPAKEMPEGEKEPEPKPAKPPEKKPEPKKEEAKPPVPVKEASIVEEEPAVEEGLEVEEASKLIKPFPTKPPVQKPSPKPPRAEKPAEEKPAPETGMEFVDLGEYEEPAKKEQAEKVPPEPEEEIKAPAQPEEEIPEKEEVPAEPKTEEKPLEEEIARATSKEPAELAEPAVAEPAEKTEKPEVKPGEFVKTSAADLTESPKSFYGKTVSVEGTLRLSSRGKSDVWYVLFDDSGSTVVRNKGEIPCERCRLFAEVKQTRLGQTYLEVQRYEPL